MGCCVLNKAIQPDDECASKDQLSVLPCALQIYHEDLTAIVRPSLCANSPTDPCCTPRKVAQQPSSPAAMFENFSESTENSEARVKVVGPDEEALKTVEYTDGCSGFLALFGMC